HGVAGTRFHHPWASRPCLARCLLAEPRSEGPCDAPRRSNVLRWDRDPWAARRNRPRTPTLRPLEGVIECAPGRILDRQPRRTCPSASLAAGRVLSGVDRVAALNPRPSADSIRLGWACRATPQFDRRVARLAPTASVRVRVRRRFPDVPTVHRTIPAPG